MVEGPGATRNGRKLQPCIGLRVKSLCLGDGNDPQSDYQRFRDIVGCTVDDAFSVGKQVFCILSNGQALCLHFGMNGSLIVCARRQKQSTGTSYFRREAVSMRLEMEGSKDNIDDQAIICRGTSIQLTTSTRAYNRLERLKNQDCCSPSFQLDQVQEALRKRASAMITDALLDQDLFPGVGNIIKVEGLHRAKIHPKRVVSSLSDEQLTAVIQGCYGYAQAWLKGGRAPIKKIYNQTTCQTCHQSSSVAMAKIGNDLQRVTFWCQNCCIGPNVLQERPTNDERNQTFRPRALKKWNKVASELNSHRCPKHGFSSTILRRVRKAGANQNRIFFTCKVGQCNYFEWADRHFPNVSCSCALSNQTKLMHCSAKARLRVSKKEGSGGKWFLCCPHSSRCNNYFSWADEQKHLSPLRPYLTPLL